VSYAIKVSPGSTVQLAKIDSSADGGMDKEAGVRKLASLAEEINGLQDLLYAAADHAVLIVLQGMDTSGKDGTIRSVFRYVNPLGCRVASFKPPTPLELKHDFLWRVHQQVPEHGIISVFNRSHYEDVLVARVRELVPRSVWGKRYRQINEFEQVLSENGVVILKFYLHISQEEQESRLLAREQDVAKAWKLSATDWEERSLWDQYMQAYEAALSKCSTTIAPWYVIPADRKWFRDLAVAEVIVDMLRPLKQDWVDTLSELGKSRLKEIRKVRNEIATNGTKTASAGERS
jgi:PPK2 family polyphosphate:nucleotide phosphotransferase